MIDEEEVRDRENDDGGAGDDGAASEVEKTARRLGWRPESEWDDTRGTRRPPKFLTADEYIAKVENDVPVLRERLRHQDQQIGVLDTKVTDLSGKLGESTALIKTLVEQNKSVGKRAYEKAKRELAAEKLAAVSAADTDAYAGVVQREQELDKEFEDVEVVATRTETKPAVVAQPTATTEPDPITKAWLAENTWFTKDPVLNAFARSENDAVWAKAKEDGESLGKLDALIETKRRVVEKFPERFGINPRRNSKGSVNEPRGGQEKPKKPGQHTFDDLPEDAQQTYERLKVQFADRGEKYTKEEYVADYQF